jgi:Transport and Golgi organisation 2
MCTLTVTTCDNGYLVGMNRDERVARGPGLEPATYEADGTYAIYPTDGEGGTWIGVNGDGVTLALLNWNDIVQSVEKKGKRRSRGLVIPSLLGARSLADLQLALDVVEFREMLPFRLVGIFPLEKQISEWRWNSAKLTCQVRAWASFHWFSSSLSDAQAESVRGAACRTAQEESGAGSVPWLRKLHRSHTTGSGAFSLCVHREDVETLSYSEIEVIPDRVLMRHCRGNPCSMTTLSVTERVLGQVVQPPAGR